jgi:hypothetical protein
MSQADSQRLQICDALKQRYFGMVLALPGNQDAAQKEKNRLSRSLAAFAVEKLGDVTPAQAANAVVDGGNDNGLDAIHFDRQKNILWVVQSKLGGAPDMGENKKFCDGIRDLIASRFNKFNPSFTRLQADVEDALESPNLQIFGRHIHLGDQALGTHAVTDLNQLKSELNQFVVRFDWQEIGLVPAHGWLTAEHAVAPVITNLVLRNWHGFEQPRRAYYGLVLASDLAALYLSEGKKLFEKNIRHYLGAQEVNTAISATVQDRPADLFYLNNGLTAICSTITPLPGFTHDIGRFRLEDFSIVNGAQTVGSIATAQSANGPVSADAKLLITLIQVGRVLPNPGSEITRARNTQNAVRGLHFAALDPEQERLRVEMAVSGIIYHYRPSAEAGTGGNRITVERAAIALAALSGTTRTVVAAKKESGELYNRDGSIYPTLFHPGVSGIHVSRAVRIHENLDNILASSERAETDYYRRMFYRHGRFFILHVLARRMRSLIEKPESQLTVSDQTELSRALLELAELIYTAAEARFNRSKGYLAIFRNLTDAEPLARDVMQRLAQQDAQRQAAQTGVVTPAATTPSSTVATPSSPTTQPTDIAS